MAEPPVYYFAYGSNLNRADMRVRCPGAKALTAAVLAGWRLTFRGVADVEPAAGMTVHGALWRLAPGGLRALDRYEGAPHLYEHRSLAVEAESGRLEAVTYVMRDDGYLGLPSPWYFGRIAAGYDDWGLPRAALAAALRATREELAGRGISRFRSDGPRRPRGIAD